MSDIAPLEDIKTAFDTAAKFIHVIADGGVTNDQFRLPIDDRAARKNLVAFLKAGCPVFAMSEAKSKSDTIAAPAIIKPASTILKPKRPFDPTFFGSGWTIWLGLEDGDGLKGEIECDQRSMALTELDLALIEPTIILRKRESYTTRAEQIARVKKERPDRIRLDPCFPLALRDKPEKYPEAWKGKAICWDGLTLRSPDGDRYSVYSIWYGSGVALRCGWHGGSRRSGDLSALLASKHLAPVA